MDASTRTTTSEPAFHGDDLDEEAGYSSLSALAIVSLLFGLASMLALAGPLFLVIPLVGIVLSIVALRRIAASEGALSGRGAAITGLVLCILFASAAVSRDRSIQYLRARQAEEFAREWIGLLLAERLEQGFELTAAATAPPPPPDPIMPPPETDPFEDFVNHPVIQALTAAGPQADVDFVETLEYHPYPARQFVVRQRYVITTRAADAESPEPVDVVLTLHRTRPRGQQDLRWSVAGYEAYEAANMEVR